MTAQGTPPPSPLIASFALTHDPIEEIKGTAAAHGALYLSAFVASSAELLGTEQAGGGMGRLRDGRLVDVEVAAEVGRGVGEHVGIGYGGS